MKIEKERFYDDLFLPPWTRYEHEARFSFVTQFVARKVVVDCACGSGISGRIFAKAQAKHVHAFDIDKEAISRAASEYHVSNLSYYCANAYCLPLQDDCADVFVSLETIEHLEDDSRFLVQVTRLLRSDGLFICSTPNRTVYSPGATLIDKPWNAFHVREYSTDEFVTILSKHFQSIQLYAQNDTKPSVVTFANLLSVRLGKMVAVRFNQILKLSRFVRSSPDKHRLLPYTSECQYEFIVACCRNPLKSKRT